MLATPTDLTSLGLMGMFVLALCAPLILKYHYPLLIFAWNSWILVFIFPGQPALGVVMSVFSLMMSVLTRTMSRRSSFIHLRSLALPLILLAVVVAVTARFTGGISGRALGGEIWGAKRYLGVFGAIIGYFALTAQRIPAEKAGLYSSLFVIGGLTAMCCDLVFMAGPSFYFLFNVFPSMAALTQAATQDTLQRFTGLSFAGLAGYSFLFMRYGIHGTFDLTKPWRLLFLFICAGVSFIGGYRSLVIILILVMTFQFYFEGLFRSRLFPIFLLTSLLVGAFLVAFIQELPLSVQRSLSFLPLDVDPMALTDALSTAEWRLSMWKAVLPDVPKYLLLGKGFAYSGTDFTLTSEAMRRGLYTAYEDTMIAGNYHQGALTLLIPFGIFGFLAFLWFCVSGLRVLYLNYRYGEAHLKLVNTFLLPYFCARLLFYLTIYGQFDLDFVIFTGTVGMSVALNGGVRSFADKHREREEALALEAMPAPA
ncbi:MAG: hypothetical protein HY043_07130 [Verrucomicrobia bacterium]|nr:hypothetical protein [Verrucomicrobiota bacterium]